MVTLNHDRMILYVVASTLGSLTGCLIMYFVGRKGGESLLRKRFATATVDRAMAAFERWGVLVVLIPAILPPPAPFKIFVLLSGVAGISLGKFVTAIVIGRGSRYLTLGILALWYGKSAMAYMEEHGLAVAAAAIGLVLAGVAGYLIWSRVQRAKSL
jgi:membrane protein YqaA with SNARE-associated domain